MIRVLLAGLGAIGQEVAKALLRDAGVRIVAAVDPARAGQDVGDVASLGKIGVVVSATWPEALAIPADVAVVLTRSGVRDVSADLSAALAAGLHVVSTCEDLASPDWSEPAIAARLDEEARRSGRVVLGTGINPGLVMDRLPLTLAAACVTVERVWVERVVDAARRRGPLRAKVGADLTPAEFAAGVAAGRLGHRGLAESCALVARGLGFTLDRISTTILPVLSTAEAPRATIAVGNVAGLRQSATGLRAGREAIRLDLEMSVAAPSPHDRIVIEGDPPIDATIAGGIHGDRGTVGAVMSALPVVATLAPGLRTILDLPARRAADGPARRG